MKKLARTTVAMALAAFQAASGSGEPEGLTAEKMEMAQVFAEAWLSGENSVGIYSMPEFEEADYWCGGTFFHNAYELLMQGYGPLALRKSLKGNPPHAMYFQSGLVMDGKGPRRPFLMSPGARVVFVLRRLPPGGQGEDNLVFLGPTSGTTREYFMAEGGYAGVGCLEWPMEDRFGNPVPNIPKYVVRLSEEELEDFKRCGEWVAGNATKTPETPWGRALKQIVTKREVQPSN